MQCDQENSNIGRLDTDREGKPANLTQGRVRRDPARGEADDWKDDEDKGLQKVALDQQEDQSAGLSAKECFVAAKDLD
jgi:hypothetical protein